MAPVSICATEVELSEPWMMTGAVELLLTRRESSIGGLLKISSLVRPGFHLTNYSFESLGMHGLWQIG